MFNNDNVYYDTTHKNVLMDTQIHTRIHKFNTCILTHTYTDNSGNCRLPVLSPTTPDLCTVTILFYCKSLVHVKVGT